MVYFCPCQLGSQSFKKIYKNVLVNASQELFDEVVLHLYKSHNQFVIDGRHHPLTVVVDRPISHLKALLPYIPDIAHSGYKMHASKRENVSVVEYFVQHSKNREWCMQAITVLSSKFGNAHISTHLGYFYIQDVEFAEFYKRQFPNCRRYYGLTIQPLCNGSMPYEACFREIVNDDEYAEYIQWMMQEGGAFVQYPAWGHYNRGLKKLVGSWSNPEPPNTIKSTLTMLEFGARPNKDCIINADNCDNIQALNLFRACSPDLFRRVASKCWTLRDNCPFSPLSLLSYCLRKINGERHLYGEHDQLKRLLPAEIHMRLLPWSKNYDPNVGYKVPLTEY